MVSTHNQPTEYIPTLDDSAEVETPLEARRGLGWLPRLVLLVLVAIVSTVAAGLVLTPPREKILVLGSDARPDEIARGERGRTDTLLLVVADRATPRVTLVSLPRDLWVPIPGYGEERVNAAYALGGEQTAKQTVANVLGQSVDRYLLVGLQGVRDVVNSLGGVEVDVPEAIYDPEYPTDDYGIVEVRIPAGKQTMDGETALRYARTRHQDSDFGRMARQQRVLSSIRAALMNPANWTRLPAVAAAVQGSTRSDLTVLDVIAVGAAFLRAGEPARLVVDTSLADPIVGEGGAYLLVPKPGLAAAVSQALGTRPVSVEVLNAANVAGLGRSTASRLSAEGFAVGRVADAPTSQARTTIVARPVSRPGAEAVARVLGLPGDRVSDASGLPEGVDVQVLVGADLAR